MRHTADDDDQFGVNEPPPVLVRGLGIGRRPWDFGHADPLFDDLPAPHDGTFTSASGPRRKPGRLPRRASSASPDARHGEDV